MKHNGWKNAETEFLAEWIARSHFSSLIKELAEDCFNEAAKVNAPTDAAVDALTRTLEERVPQFLTVRLRGIIEDTSLSDPDSFTVSLAHAAMLRVDWSQLAEHWSGNCAPVQFHLDDDEQPGNVSGD